MTTPAEVSYLWRRAAFGISADGAEDRAGRPWAELVDELVDPDPAPMAHPASAFQAGNTGAIHHDMVTAWLEHMATTPTPGSEKLTWFWHTHFPVSRLKASTPHALVRYIDILRDHGFGDFRTLLERVVLDWAMVVYLDNQSNTSSGINENLGRELLEVFTIGVDNFTQADVVGAARSLTGHTGTFEGIREPVFRPELHDTGAKTVCGVTGDFDGPGLMDVLCSGPRRALVAERLTSRLWQQWAYPNPSRALVAELSSRFIDAGFTGRALMRTVLMHPELRSHRARRALPMTPLDVAVALIRIAGVPTAAVRAVYFYGVNGAGYGPLLPPNVGGWPAPRRLWSPASWWAVGTMHLEALAHVIRTDPGWYRAIKALAPRDAAVAILRHVGVHEPRPDTVAAIADGIASNSGTDTSGLDHAIFLAAVLSPDFLAPD